MRIHRLSAWCLIFLLWGCASRPSIDYDTAMNFSSLKTYYIVPVEQSDDSIMAQRLAKGIDRALETKGLKSVSEREKADFAVLYHARAVEAPNPTRMSIGVGGGSYGSSGGVGVGGSVGVPVGGSTVTHQSIEIDLVDSKTDQAFWRGSDTYKLKINAGALEREAAANEAIFRILNEFPPGKK